MARQTKEQFVEENRSELQRIYGDEYTEDKALALGEEVERGTSPKQIINDLRRGRESLGK